MSYMKTRNTSTALNSNSIFISEELKDRIDIDSLIDEKIIQTDQKDYGSFSVNLLIDNQNHCYNVNTVDFDIGEVVIEAESDRIKELFIPFSEKQIKINSKVSDYIIKNVDRSYDKIFKFIKDVDELSLSSGKSININLIKKVLNQ